MDLRRLNDLVELDEYHMPRIEELMTQLHGMKYFTTIDLKDGYFQIPIKTEDREKTSFFTGSRHMQFKKMPQGFKNSPAIFQKAMNIVL